MSHYGLLGEKLGHSYSPQIYAMLGDYEYRLYEKSEHEVDDFIRHGDWDGLNVTIPYKIRAYRLCDMLTDRAIAIGSVNTIVKKDGRIYGDNTDAYGFDLMIEKSKIDVSGKKVLVLGSGGASLAVRYVLEQKGADSIIAISRSGSDNYDNISKHSDASIIVNTTPVGMYPNNDKTPVDLGIFDSLDGVLDIIYNPQSTRLTMQAEELGIKYMSGLYMLVAQAAGSYESFTGVKTDTHVIDDIMSRLSMQMKNIVLVGMPGSGKSTLALKLGQHLHREVVDCDSEIEKEAGNIPDIFARYGEELFRGMETDVLARICSQSARVIATGGGAVTRDENYAHMHQNGIIVWVRRNLDELPIDGRPISQQNDISELYAKRESLYRKFADIEIENDGDIDAVVVKLIQDLES